MVGGFGGGRSIMEMSGDNTTTANRFKSAYKRTVRQQIMKGDPDAKIVPPPPRPLIALAKGEARGKCECPQCTCNHILLFRPLGRKERTALIQTTKAAAAAAAACTVSFWHIYAFASLPYQKLCAGEPRAAPLCVAARLTSLAASGLSNWEKGVPKAGSLADRLKAFNGVARLTPRHRDDACHTRPGFCV